MVRKMKCVNYFCTDPQINSYTTGLHDFIEFSKHSLDDPDHMNDIEQLLVDFFNRGARGTVTHQARVPHTTPIITMNDIMLQNSIR